MSIEKVFVLTTEFAEYNQEGEYFVAVFGEKPDREKLMTAGVPENRIRNVLNGGGRVDDLEHQWFFLREQALK